MLKMPSSEWSIMNASDKELLYQLADLIDRDHYYLPNLEPLAGEYLSHVIKCYRYFA